MNFETKPNNDLPDPIKYGELFIIAWKSHNDDHHHGNKRIRLLEQYSDYAQGYLPSTLELSQDGYDIEAFCVHDGEMERFIELLGDLKNLYGYEFDVCRELVIEERRGLNDDEFAFYMGQANDPMEG